MSQHDRGPRGVQPAATLAEDLDLGVAEAVDRLQLVADREEVVVLQQPQQRELAAVGVLELVHHQELDALRPPAAHPIVTLQQIASAQLEVVEVECRAGALERRVAIPVRNQNFPQQRTCMERLQLQRVIGHRVPVGQRLDIEQRGLHLR